MDIQIIILQRGWVIVGAYTREGMYGRITRGAIIRDWGTAGKNTGLGYLAQHGPTDSTVLEPVTTEMRFLELTTVAFLQCAPLWEKIITELVMPE